MLISGSALGKLQFASNIFLKGTSYTKCVTPPPRRRRGDDVAKANNIHNREKGFISPVVFKEGMIAFCICSQHSSIVLTLTLHSAAECDLMAFPSLALVLWASTSPPLFHSRLQSDCLLLIPFIMRIIRRLFHNHHKEHLFSIPVSGWIISSQNGMYAKWLARGRSSYEHLNSLIGRHNKNKSFPHLVLFLNIWPLHPKTNSQSSNPGSNLTLKEAPNSSVLFLYSSAASLCPRWLFCLDRNMVGKFLTLILYLYCALFLMLKKNYIAEIIISLSWILI